MTDPVPWDTGDAPKMISLVLGDAIPPGDLLPQVRVWPSPVLPPDPIPATRASIQAPLEGELLLSAWRLFSASLCCSPASTLDEILRKSSLFIHFNFLPSPVAAYNHNELRDLL